MKSSNRVLFSTLFLVAVCTASSALAQTPDDQTPAVEGACDKYEGEGARQGLCIAYCEAQDCDGIHDGSESCLRLEERFIEYSVRKGYLRAMPKPGARLIDCQQTSCTADDIEYCGGREQDCIDPNTRECVIRCAPTFNGFDSAGNPMCSIQRECQGCLKDATCEANGTCDPIPAADETP